MNRTGDHSRVDPTPSGLLVLPTGWAWATLGLIADIKGGITKGQKRREEDMLRLVPYLRVANVQRGFLDLQEVKLIAATENEIETLRLEAGDILFNEGGDRDKLGRGWVWRGEIAECIHQNHVFRGRLCSSEMEPKLISLYGNSFGQQYFIDQGKQTTNLASINLTKLAAFPIPLPPVNEQRRIVAAIEEQFTRLDAAVAGLKRVRANLKRYRAAVLKAACEGRLVPTEAELARAEGREYEPADRLLARILEERHARWEAEQLAKMRVAQKAKYEEPTRPDAHDMSGLPEGWTQASINQLRVRSEYGTSVRCTEDATGFPVLRIPNIARGCIDLDNLKYATQPLSLREDDLLQPGDLLMCRTNGSINLVGRTAMVRARFETPHYFASYLLRFRLAEPTVLPRWIDVVAASVIGRAFLEKHAASSAGQHNVSLSLIHRWTVPIPPLAEQQRIVVEVERRLSVVEKLEATVEVNLRRAERTRQAILKRAFEGKLVPQDPNDEPASVLLERIRAERAAQEVNGTGRRRKRTAEPSLPLPLTYDGAGEACASGDGADVGARSVRQ